MVRKIKLFDPAIDKEEISSVTKVLKSKFWASGAGVANVNKFENQHGEIKDVDPTGGIPMNFGGPTTQA